jgi:hypothetical protein
MQNHKINKALVVCALTATAILGVGAASAQAHLTGNYTTFEQCPYANLEVKKCIYSTTESGEVVLGSKKVPIVNPVVLQGGAGKAVEEYAPFFEATNGITLSKAAQPVPGGLAGLINCKEIGNLLLRLSCEAALEGPLTGVNSTLELAKPASEIVISENRLAAESGVALKIPVKVHLENPFLGKSCYVGSSTTPIIWELTSGTTEPPGPNKAITGKAGFIEFLEEGRIAVGKEVVLVDNAWSAPGASGCGGALVELLLDPVINVSAGLPAAAGHNTAILNNVAIFGSAAAVRKNDAENP